MFVTTPIANCLALGMYHVGTKTMFFAYALAGIGYVSQASNFAWANGTSSRASAIVFDR